MTEKSLARKLEKIADKLGSVILDMEQDPDLRSHPWMHDLVKAGNLVNKVLEEAGEGAQVEALRQLDPRGRGV